MGHEAIPGDDNPNNCPLKSKPYPLPDGPDYHFCGGSEEPSTTESSSTEGTMQAEVRLVIDYGKPTARFMNGFMGCLRVKADHPGKYTVSVSGKIVLAEGETVSVVVYPANGAVFRAIKAESLLSIERVRQFN